MELLMERSSHYSLSTDHFQKELKLFINRDILPYVDDIEKGQRIHPNLIHLLSERGFLGVNIPKKYQGMELDDGILGIFHEEFGKSHASIENLLTVVGMASTAILRGGKLLSSLFLPKIARGEIIPAFALTEPGGGSDIRSIMTSYKQKGSHYILNGSKKWITLGAIADIFVVFAQDNGRGSAFILHKDNPGLQITPIKDMLGFRGNMLAELEMKNCFIPKEHMIGIEGTGFDIVASLALNEGRYTTAWGAVGLAQAAMDRALHFIMKSKRHGKPLRDLDLVKQKIAEMSISLDCARLLCQSAGNLKTKGDANTIKAIMTAKYHSSKTTAFITQSVVQLLGAYGCHYEGVVERYFRDSKIYELIEGSSEILALQIADMAMNASQYE